MRIALIDYRAGNLTSVRKALAAAGAEVFTPDNAAQIAGADGLIVPGVGHFEATAVLDAPWREAILAHARAGKPLLGICLGLQFLFEGSIEAPGLTGLGLLPGVCGKLGPDWDPGVRLSDDAWSEFKVPHVGWNAVDPTRPSTILAGVAPGAQAYFTHSYAAPVGEATAATTTTGPNTFASAVERGNIFGLQFHPEKSADAGVAMLRNFCLRATRPGLGSEPGSELSPEPGSEPSSELGRNVAGTAHHASKRIIACLDVRDGQVVKGVKFEGLRSAGDPAELAARYNVEGIDEVVILDVTATLETRRALAQTIRDVARTLFIPLAVGGGIRTEDDAAAVVDAGADKVSLNSAALKDPDLIARLAVRYGSQAVVVAIDAKRGPTTAGPDGFAVYARSGTSAAGRDAVEWAREAASRGAGEILLTSMDRDGTRSGFDCELTAAVSRAVSIPVIASGGAGSFDHFVDVFTRGRADAALAASIFHFSEHGVADLKQHLATAGIPMRIASGG
ncbi:MAG: imidazole glycerol phosphate synthase subunit HisF [Vicinamibacteraceae bacterium]